MYGINLRKAVEQRQGMIKALKLSLAQELAASANEDEYLPAERIAKIANEIAENEGALQVLLLRLRLEEQGAEKDQIASALLREAVRGSDDQWSGRANDVRRAFADGRRDALDDAQFDLYR